MNQYAQRAKAAQEKLAAHNVYLWPQEHQVLQNVISSTEAPSSAELLSALDCVCRRAESDNFHKEGQYFFGIDHLTRTADGYMMWKGKQVEHYSHDKPENMFADAVKLAAGCADLEAKNFPVNARTAICPVMESMPAGSPWKDAALRFYSLAKNNAGRYAATLYSTAFDGVVIIDRDTSSGATSVYAMEEAYDAFHFVASTGLRSIAPVRSYEQLQEFFEASGITPDQVQEALSSTSLPQAGAVA